MGISAHCETPTVITFWVYVRQICYWIPNYSAGPLEGVGHGYQLSSRGTDPRPTQTMGPRMFYHSKLGCEIERKAERGTMAPKVQESDFMQDLEEVIRIWMDEARDIDRGRFMK